MRKHLLSFIDRHFRLQFSIKVLGQNQIDLTENNLTLTAQPKLNGGTFARCPLCATGYASRLLRKCKQAEQRCVHGLGSWKGFCDSRFEQSHRCAFHGFRIKLAALQTCEVRALVLRPHFVFNLLHKFSLMQESARCVRRVRVPRELVSALRRETIRQNQQQVRRPQGSQTVQPRAPASHGRPMRRCSGKRRVPLLHM